MKSMKVLMLAAAAAGMIGLMAEAIAQNAPAGGGAPAAGAPAGGAAAGGRGRGGRGPAAPPPQAWVPKLTRLTRYEAPNRPIWRLADVKAMHSATGSWTQPIVRNKEMWADYVQIAAGERTPRLMRK